jgi:hypothetical protein
MNRLLNALGFKLRFVGKACPAQPEVRYPPWHHLADEIIMPFVPCPYGDDVSWEHYHPRWSDWRIVGWRWPL